MGFFLVNPQRYLHLTSSHKRTTLQVIFLLVQLNIDYPNIGYPNIQLSGMPIGSRSPVFSFPNELMVHNSVLAVLRVHVHMQDMTKTSYL